MKTNVSALVATLALGMAVSVAIAVGDIQGAFGMQLGDALPEGDARITETQRFSRDSGLRYAFDPENPFGALDEYHVLLTPKTRRIYRISASGEFGSALRCEEELLALHEALEAKYGPGNDNIGDAVVSSMTGVKAIRFGYPPRRIVATCVGVMREHLLSLHYIDDDLESRAKAETAQMGEGDYKGRGL